MLAVPAHAATFTVDSNADGEDLIAGDGICATASGNCTLRAAIEEANALAGPDIIQFNLPTPGGNAYITPNSALPAISTPIAIDGASQPGTSSNTQAVGSNAVIKVVIDGIHAGDANGLVFQPGANGGAGVHDVMITRFQRNGVLVTGNVQDVSIQGNFIGTDGSGDANDIAGYWSNGVGWAAVSVFNGPTRTSIGGPNPAHRNLLGGKGRGVVVADNANTNTVQNNYIGVGRSGNLRQPLTEGVVITGSGDNLIAGNIIGASDNGVDIVDASEYNALKGNRIGLGADGQTSIAGSGVGVFISDRGTGAAPRSNGIGGVGVGDPNTIANWGSHGVAMVQMGSQAAAHNYVLGNSIYANGGLGIELVNQKDGIGAGPNTANPTPGVNVNGGQPFPVISDAQATPQGLSLTFDFTGNAGTRLEVFASPSCDKSGYGQGQTLVTASAFQGSGPGPFTATNLPAVAAGQWITMTATSNDGDTSEFSRCFQVKGNNNPGGNPGGNPGNVAAVPTLGHAGLALLSACMAGVGVLRRRKRG